MKTAEDYLKESIKEYNATVSDFRKFSMTDTEITVFANCMKAYAEQAIDQYRKLLDKSTSTYQALNTINEIAEQVKQELK